ncbi:oligosaccharide flippase family protein [Streptomyces sp. H10-C2]|uniref:lipopolysaccharide biosynthesis protein n=1 Tax=unclassified Streptomyces TaxID=2593676 RepID=UPI0024BB1C87|nr:MULTISPECIES: oligosaccharide flippase family protein [unclassified Streptomyces]MDJ0341180.1 oligosaccharide flippase family protein [Streptomyces sp. PH10-H1]MDJ0369467.1 oligosaccharide flippase family protein [Streptomyces sp. H10-C2]
MARNSARLLAARVATSLAGVASLPLVYGQLGSRAYGVWALLAGLVAVASLADLGLGSAQIREVARVADGGQQRQARAVLGLGLVWGALLGVLALAGTAICWPWLAHACHLGELTAPARSAALLLLVGFLLDSLAMPWRAVLEGTQCYAPVAWVVGGTSLIGAGLAVTVVELGGGLVELAGSVVVTSALRALMFVGAARRYAARLRPSLRAVTRSDVAYVMAYGSRVQVANAAAAVNSETDRLVLAGFFGPAATAGFDLGSRLVGLLRLPSGIILTAVFPAAAAAQDDPGRLDRLYIEMTRYLAVFAAVGAAMLVVSADPLVRLWLGHPLPSATVTIAILAPGYAVSTAAGAAAVVTRAEGSPGRETRSGVVAAVLNLLLTVPLLCLLGPRGVPLSTTLAAFGATGYFFAHFHYRSRRPVAPLLRALWPPAFAAAVAGALTWMVAFDLPSASGRVGAALVVAFRGGLTVLITAAFLALLGFFDAGDRSRLSVITSQLRPRRSAVPAMDSE